MTESLYAVPCLDDAGKFTGKVKNCGATMPSLKVQGTACLPGGFDCPICLGPTTPAEFGLVAKGLGLPPGYTVVEGSINGSFTLHQDGPQYPCWWWSSIMIKLQFAGGEPADFWWEIVVGVYSDDPREYFRVTRLASYSDSIEYDLLIQPFIPDGFVDCAKGYTFQAYGGSGEVTPK